MSAVETKGSAVGSGLGRQASMYPKSASLGKHLTALGTEILRYGLVFLLIGIG